MSMVVMVMDEGTCYGLERDSKVHDHIRGVGEDNGLCTSVKLDVLYWHRIDR